MVVVGFVKILGEEAVVNKKLVANASLVIGLSLELESNWIDDMFVLVGRGLQIPRSLQCEALGEGDEQAGDNSVEIVNHINKY